MAQSVSGGANKAVLTLLENTPRPEYQAVGMTTDEIAGATCYAEATVKAVLTELVAARRVERHRQPYDSRRWFYRAARPRE